MRDVILPTIRGMDKDGIPFTGFLYAGSMIDAGGKPKTLEFNTRMGDPGNAAHHDAAGSPIWWMSCSPPPAASWTRSNCNGTAASPSAW